MKTTILSSLLLATALLATASADETLAQKSAHKVPMDSVDGSLKGANTTCGTSITATVEWEGFDKLDLSHITKSNGPAAVGQWCGWGISAVGDICSSMKDDGKAAVKAKIQKYVCRYGGEGKRSIDVANGTFTYSIDFKVYDGGTSIRQDLAKKM